MSSSVSMLSENKSIWLASLFSEIFLFFKIKLGGIKAVGYEAISNIVKERELNGKFESINDFIIFKNFGKLI